MLISTSYVPVGVKLYLDNRIFVPVANVASTKILVVA